MNWLWSCREPRLLDLRRGQRLRLCLPVQVQVGERTFFGETCDFSRGGLGLSVEQALLCGTRVSLRLLHPGSLGTRVRANVLWSRGGRLGLAYAPQLLEQTWVQPILARLKPTWKPRRQLRWGGGLWLHWQTVGQTAWRRAECVNLSQGGCCLRLSGRLRIGHRLRISFGEVLELFAEVVAQGPETVHLRFLTGLRAPLQRLRAMIWQLLGEGWTLAEDSWLETYPCPERRAILVDLPPTPQLLPAPTPVLHTLEEILDARHVKGLEARPGSSHRREFVQRSHSLWVARSLPIASQARTARQAASASASDTWEGVALPLRPLSHWRQNSMEGPSTMG